MINIDEVSKERLYELYKQNDTMARYYCQTLHKINRDFTLPTGVRKFVFDEVSNLPYDTSRYKPEDGSFICP